MYKTVHETRKFNTDDEDDLKNYDAVLNDPLCTVVSERKEKLETCAFDEGKIVSSEEHIILVVTWSKKVLL